MNKKASISLSVNMIIVMIIGIVILGLALGFVKGIFGGLGKQMEQLASEEPEPDAPTPSDPITLSNDHKILASKDTAVMKIRVLNPTDQASTSPTAPAIVGSTCGVSPNTLTLINPQVNGKKIQPSATEDFLYVFQVSNAKAGTYLCQMKITVGTGATIRDLTKDFTIEIQG